MLIVVRRCAEKSVRMERGRRSLPPSRDPSKLMPIRAAIPIGSPIAILSSNSRLRLRHLPILLHLLDQLPGRHELRHLSETERSDIASDHNATVALFDLCAFTYISSAYKSLFGRWAEKKRSRERVVVMVGIDVPSSKSSPAQT